MADTTAATGLMPHQKDEHDIWICKDCGWKYPNAKPSAKIRKNHKKHCPGKSGANANAHGGGSSDDAASDDEHHHHSSSKGAEAVPASEVESKSRDFDLATSAKEEASPVAIPKETKAVADVSSAAGGHEEPKKTDGGNEEGALAGKSNGLMPHQKDEHDIWICKDCGWKYPNAKPSAKVRKHHKKNCPGKSGVGAGAAGGSSDEASDDEHHHHHHRGGEVMTEAAASKGAESTPAATAPSEAPPVTSKEIDFASLQKPEEEITASDAAAPEGTQAGAVSLKDAIQDGTKGDTEKPLSLQEAITRESEHEQELGAASGLMPHQKDETDIWVCKQCGWKYPNAKPSPKIRKNHKKKCPGSSTGAIVAGGSSDEASDDDHAAAPGKSHTSGTVSTAPDEAKAPKAEIASKEFVPEVKAPGTEPSYAAMASIPAAEGDESTKASVTKEEDGTVTGGLMPHQKDEKDIWVCKACGWKYPNAKPSAKIRKNHKAKCPGKGGAKKKGGGSSEDASSGDEKFPGGKCFPCL